MYTLSVTPATYAPARSSLYIHPTRTGFGAGRIHSEFGDITTTDAIQIRLFGNLHISVAGSPVTAVNTNRLHSLIAWLILQGDVPQPRERLASLLWPESNGAQARTNLRQLLHHLKRALPAECVSLRADHFAVHWQQDDSCSIDVVQFQSAIAQAASAKERGDVTGEAEQLAAAAQIYADDLLPTLYDDWLKPLRQDYRNRLSTALHRLASLLEEQSKIPAAIPLAERLVAHDSLSETNYQLLIRLHAANNDRASALRTYHQCMTVLRREMGVQPGPATMALFQSVLKADRPAPAPAARPAPELKAARQLVGRSAEKQRLDQAWQSVMGDGPRAVIISGEPGIGKTRLAEELLQLGDKPGNAVARSRCYSGQGQVPYAPIAEWLRSDAVRAAWPKLTSPQLAELARLVPEIRESYPNLEQPHPLTETWHKLQLYESLHAVFAKTAHPLLLFIDDLQWCDPDSLEWLQSLLFSPAAKGILLLGAVRGEETGRDHPFTAFMAALRQAAVALEIPLAPLSAADTTELARMESAEPLESEKLGEIFHSTKGNPLFVLESIRAGLQSTRVHAVISSRLAKLSAASYDLAGLASVVGRPFSFELLEKASDWDERSLSEALDELWQRRIIEGRGGSEYDFTHDRLREVATAELSLVRHRYLHRRIARALAEVHRNDLENWNGQIASHYEQAGMGEQAIEHFHLAANSARQRFAYTEAAELLRRALELCRQFPDSQKNAEQELDLLLLLGTVLVTTEGYSSPSIGVNYQRALELSRRLDNRNLLAILSGLWVFHVVRGDTETSRQDALEFLKAAGKNPQPETALAGNFILGSSLYHLGQLEAALHHMTNALQAHSGPADSVLALFAGPDVGVFCRSYLSHLAWHRASQDDDASAVIRSDEAIESAEQMRHPFSQAIALDYAAMLHIFRRDSRRALEVGRQAVELCSRHAFVYYLAVANILTGWAVVAEGDAILGLAQLRQGFDSMRALGAEIRLPYYYALLAESYGRAGLFREATASLSTGFAFASKNGEDWAVSELHRVQGDLLAAEGKPEQAAISYRRGVESARQCGSLAFERNLTSLIDRTPDLLSTERS
jgi:DNA-binding SARP family transcriptional activator/predicted ATPase